MADIRAVIEPAGQVAAHALATLQAGQRLTVGRDLVGAGWSTRRWAPSADSPRAYQPTRTRNPGWTPLSTFVDRHLEGFQGLHPAARPSGSKNRPMLRRWRSLHDAAAAIEEQRRVLEEACQGLEQAHAQAVQTRQRAAREAEHRQREQQQAAEARARADQAAQTAQQVADLADRVEAHRGRWAVSSRRLRERGWTGLLKALCDGTRDDDRAVLVPGIPREQARCVLALLQLAAGHAAADEAAAELDELLAAEDALMNEQQELADRAGSLPLDADVRSRLADLHRPDLRRACDWLTHHADHVIPVLAAAAPAEATTLRDALDRVRHTAP